MYESNSSTSTIGIQKLFTTICYLEFMLGLTIFSLLTYMQVVMLIGHQPPSATSVLLIDIFYIVSSLMEFILAAVQIRSTNRRNVRHLRICLCVTLVLIFAEGWIYFYHYAHKFSLTPGSTTMLYLIIVKITVLVCGSAFYKQLSDRVNNRNGQYWPIEGGTHYYNNQLYDIHEHHEEHDEHQDEYDDERQSSSDE